MSTHSEIQRNTCTPLCIRLEGWTKAQNFQSYDEDSWNLGGTAAKIGTLALGIILSFVESVVGFMFAGGAFLLHKCFNSTFFKDQSVRCGLYACQSLDLFVGILYELGWEAPANWLDSD